MNTGGSADRRIDALRVVLVLAILSFHPPIRLSAQLRLSLGARHTTTLVRDSIVTPFTVRPALAPTAVASFAVADREPWRAYGTADISVSQLQRHENDSSLDIQSVAMLGFGAELERRIVTGLDVRAGLGGLLYLTDKSGVFRLGTGGLHPTGALGARYAPPFATGLGLSLDVRYDVHRFNTRALKNAGFLEGRLVSRLTVAVSRRVP
jgi:hypothetical protein